MFVMRLKIVDHRIAEIETMAVRHSFKIYGGLIRAAEAYCGIIPTGTGIGWE